MHRIIILAIFYITSTLGKVHLCDNVYSHQNLDLTANEKKLICNKVTPGWELIPEYQKTAMIQEFLKERGHYNSKIENRENSLFVKPGKKTFINDIIIKNAPADFYKENYYQIKKKVLNSSNLEEVASWVKNRMATIGHPCAKIDYQASFVSGNIKFLISNSKPVYINMISRPTESDHHSSIFSRYDAFKLKDLYNQDYINLTNQRVKASGLVSYSYFDHDCKKPNQINQSVLPTTPNKIIFSVGTSSDEFPIIETVWRNSKLDKKGSSSEVSVYLSNLKKEINLFTLIYPSKIKPRLAIKPELSFKRQTEPQLDFESKSIKLGLFYSKEETHNKYFFSYTPEYSFEKEIEDEIKSNQQLVINSLVLGKKSHYYEYYAASPREGHFDEILLSHFFSKENEDARGLLYSIRGVHLFSMPNQSPPDYVLGIRYSLKSLGINSIESVPQRFRLFLGGVNNVRGFSRNAINNNESGYSTTFTSSFELRFTSLNSAGLQPYFYYDIGKVALKKVNFSKTLYSSPGIGVRYESPFGNFRLSYAKGFTSDNSLTDANIHFSFGKEF